jgi:pyrimidine-nucleoside phosphorylase
MGATVSKIGVPGRPAGGLDVLGATPGYALTADLPQAREILAECGYLHVGAGDDFCPLDASLFSWRQDHGFQAVRDLAIASLLAKKFAAGVTRAVFDVRVGAHGNFGSTRSEASANSQRLVEVAAVLGIEAVCVIGTGELAQPFIGRGEAAFAVSTVLRGEATGLLLEHAVACLRLASIARGFKNDQAPDLLEVLPGARRAHRTMLEAHGADSADFDDRVVEFQDAHRTDLVAGRDGYFDLDLQRVRSAIVERQAQEVSPSNAFPDPCGVTVLVRSGERVRVNQPLLSVRAATTLTAFAEDLTQSVTLNRSAPPSMSEDTEIVNG